MYIMHILTVKATVSPDVVYPVNLTLFNSLPRVNYLKNKLNDFMLNYSKLNGQISVSDMLENSECKQKLTDIVSDCLSGDALYAFMETFTRVCTENLVYADADIFGIKRIEVVV